LGSFGCRDPYSSGSWPSPGLCVLLNLASASVAIMGTALSLLAGSVAQETVTTSLVPLTAGGFVYLAAADLIPELQHDRSLRALVTQTVLITLGIVVIGLLTFIE
jgi:zinc and cadmium transporter